MLLIHKPAKFGEATVVKLVLSKKNIQRFGAQMWCKGQRKGQAPIYVKPPGIYLLGVKRTRVLQIGHRQVVPALFMAFLQEV